MKVKSILGQGRGLGISLSYDKIYTLGGKIMFVCNVIDSLDVYPSEKSGTQYINEIPIS